MMKVGMVGIGMMGHGIATNIVKHNYPMVLLEHPGNQPLQDLVAAGATTLQAQRPWLPPSTLSSCA